MAFRTERERDLALTVELETAIVDLTLQEHVAQHRDELLVYECDGFTIEKNVPEELDIHMILDNYGTHKTKLIQDWFIKRPRFHVHFTPTSASWLNLVERWFALLTERQLRRGVHRSTKELKSAIDDFIQHHNRDPKPFVWHKTADQILDSVARFCKRTNDSVH